jgi:Ca2+-binding RTX toxin-like protein
MGSIRTSRASAARWVPPGRWAGMPIRTVLAAIVTGGIVLGAAPAADAATVAVVDGTAVFTAAPGEVNNVRAGTLAAPDTMTLKVIDSGAPLTPGPGCQQLDPNSVWCPESDPLLPLVVWADDGDDQVVVDDGLPRVVTVHGQRGNDTVHVGNGVGSPALLDGGQGDDTLTTSENGAGPPVLRGGPGNDVLTVNEHSGDAQAFGGDGNDRIINNTTSPGSLLDGGDGNDTYTFGQTFDLDAIVPGPGLDTLDETAGFFEDGLEIDMSGCPRCVQRVIGTPNDDRIMGDRHAQAILGGGGNDILDGGRGHDAIAGQNGDDTITSRDGVFDMVACGDGTDGVVADRRDLVSLNCENVTRE